MPLVSQPQRGDHAVIEAALQEIDRAIVIAEGDILWSVVGRKPS